jgi:hypothetical protein
MRFRRTSKDPAAPRPPRRRPRLQARAAMPRTGKILLALFATVLALASMVLLVLEAQGREPGHCAGCHPIEPYYDSWQSSDYEARAHSRVGVGCLSCHPRTLANELSEQVAYRTGDYSTPLREVKVGEKVCLRCHGDYGLMAARTAEVIPNPHYSHLGEVDCRVCHKMHKASINYCFDCHTAEEFEPGGQYYEP